MIAFLIWSILNSSVVEEAGYRWSLKPFLNQERYITSYFWRTLFSKSSSGSRFLSARASLAKSCTITVLILGRWPFYIPR